MKKYMTMIENAIVIPVSYRKPIVMFLESFVKSLQDAFGILGSFTIHCVLF